MMTILFESIIQYMTKTFSVTQCLDGLLFKANQKKNLFLLFHNLFQAFINIKFKKKFKSIPVHDVNKHFVRFF